MKKLAFISFLVFMCAASFSYGQKRGFGTRSNVSGSFKPRLLNITEINGGIGYYVLNRDFTKRFINMTSIFGAGLAKNLTGGLGAGVSLYDGGTLFPLFADFRYFFILGQIKVFVFGDGGILLNSARKVGETVIFVNPGAGMTLPISDKMSASLGAGLFTQFRQVEVGLEEGFDRFINVKLGVIYLF